MRVTLLLLGGLLSAVTTVHAQRAESPWFALDPGTRVRIQVGGNMIDGMFTGVRNEGVVVVANDSMRVYAPAQIESAFVGRSQAWPVAEKAFLFGALLGGAIAAFTIEDPAAKAPKIGLAAGAGAGFIGYFIGKSMVHFVPFPLR